MRCFVNWQPKGRRDILLEYVKNVQPEFMELFVKRAPEQVCFLISFLFESCGTYLIWERMKFYFFVLSLWCYV